MTAIHCAAQRYEGVLSIFIFSRQHAIDVKAADENGATALHLACVSGLIQNVQTLLKLGANPNAQDMEGNTCLHLCILQMLDIKKALI
jgi:ankyrin repeat protein